MASDPTDLIREATEAVDGFDGWVYSPDNAHWEPGDADSYCDVDGPNGGYVARCDYPETARFVAAAPGLVRRLRDALVGTPTFRCDTHRCGECAGCRARGIDDELRRAWAERDEARAALAEANATIQRALEACDYLEDGPMQAAVRHIRRAIEGEQ